MGQSGSQPDSPALALIDNLTRTGPWGPGVREYRFHPVRRWRFDLAWPDLNIAFECEGGVWSGGRHTSGKGFTDDCEKYSVAAAIGWYPIRATVQQIKKGQGFLWLSAALHRSMGLPSTPLAELGALDATRSRRRKRRIT